MPKKNEPKRADRIDMIILTGRTLEGPPVSISLLPEELALLSDSSVCGDSCEHLNALHGCDEIYFCEVCIGMGRESGGVTKKQKEKLPRKGVLHKV